MCGICGLALGDGQPPRQLIQAMCEAIRHRGPDGEGIYVGQGIGLGMRRLAVIDLVTGHQPMSNETGTVQVVFNGEIYNHQELRHELEQKGHAFHTTCDTEVLPHLYEEYGLAFPHCLNGIFAIALWDTKVKRLVLIRDRMGIKPLFYSVREGSFFFGSEIKCILAASGTDMRLDLQGLDQLLTFEYTASPWTLFRDVKKLPPGSWLRWQDGTLDFGSYWELPHFQKDPGWGEEEWARRLRDVLDRAVKRQMVSDVPLGSFLSGGVDSAILVSAMSHASHRPIKTFSIGFANDGYDELHFARQVASRYHTDHYEKIMEPTYLELVDEVIEHLDQPIGDFSVFPTLLVAMTAREQVTVALSGDGADELFAGYDSYVADRWANLTVDHLPATVKKTLLAATALLPWSEKKKGFRNTLRRFFEGICLPEQLQHMRWMTFLSPQQRQELYHPEVFSELSRQYEHRVLQYLDNPGADRLQRQLYCDTRFYLAENIMAKVDFMSMAVSLEARVPYLDNEVLDFVLTMPSCLKWNGQERKYILKRAYADCLPPGILSRKKQGFSIPLKTWLKSSWNDLMHDVLSEEEVKNGHLFNWKTINRWMKEHETGRANHSHILWSLMVFHMWKNMFLTAHKLEATPADLYPVGNSA